LDNTTEAELAKIVVDWLNLEKWEVYQEVSYGWGRPVIDIVAVRGQITWAIEVKKSLSLALIEQAHKHLYQANYVSITVPDTSREVKGHFIAGRMLNHWGIGILKISRRGILREEAEARLHRTHKGLNLRRLLNESQKTFAEAGNSEGKHWSPFQETVRCLKAFVESHPGCLLKDAVESINHHYASTAGAKTSLVQWIRTGVIKGICLEKEGRYLKLYLSKG